MELSGVEFFFVFLAISIVIGIVAVLGGVGGGVVFTPLMMGFTAIDSFIIRATGLLVAMAGSLVAARPFLNRGLANIRLLLLAGVPYAIFAVIGALLAGYVKETAGDTGEAIIRLSLGALVIGIAALILFGFTRLRGDISSASFKLIRSCTVRRSFKKPLRSSSLANSSMVRKRRLPK